MSAASDAVLKLHRDVKARLGREVELESPSDREPASFRDGATHYERAADGSILGCTFRADFDESFILEEDGRQTPVGGGPSGFRAPGRGYGE